MAEKKSQMTSLTYRDAGVNIDAGDALVDAIKPAAMKTNRPGANPDLGGFGGLFDLKAAGLTDPILVAATDGVGTNWNWHRRLASIEVWVSIWWRCVQMTFWHKVHCPFFSLIILLQASWSLMWRQAS